MRSALVYILVELADDEISWYSLSAAHPESYPYCRFGGGAQRRFPGSWIGGSALISSILGVADRTITLGVIAARACHMESRHAEFERE